MNDKEPYKVHIWGDSMKISDDLLDDSNGQIQRAMNEAMSSVMRWTLLRHEVQVGAGLSHEDAKLVLDTHDQQAETIRELSAKPPPTMLHTLRAWLAHKIKPPMDEEDYE